MSRQSSITFYKCNDEFRTIYNYLIVFGGILLTVESIIIIIRSMGIIELRGVLSSWATDEKNMFLIFCISFWFYLKFVISVQIAIICSPLLITEVFTCMYRLGFLALNTLSYFFSFLMSLFYIMCSHRFYF